MSRRALSGPPAAEQGICYTLHFDPPYPPNAPEGAQIAKHQHWATDRDAHLDARLATHEAGRGARLTQVQREAGATRRLASVEGGDWDRERQLKKHSAARRSPIRKTEVQTDASPRPAPEPEREAGL